MKYDTPLCLLITVAVLLSGCNTAPAEDTDKPIDAVSESNVTTSTESTDSTEAVTEKSAGSLPEDFVFPITDGSTSTTNLDNAVRSAILGEESKIAHTKTYTAFGNLLGGKCRLIFTTPLSDSQLKSMETAGFRHEAEPVAGEGFVFVVNKNNPVDTLTVEQLKGIYSGEITNWSEVGGEDAEIVAYQRNADSGSQNYMLAFMGDTPLMKPVTKEIPASMSGILDVVASYDNGKNAIGYSVYAYSDGMYENIAEIKYIKVNGVAPSPETLADGSYPLLGYNYAVFSAEEADDSDVRALVRWMQSDEGQQVIADAGYIPYRRVEGLTLPEASVRSMYRAVGTSGIERPKRSADYYYQCMRIPTSYTTRELNEKVQDFIDEATARLSQADEAKRQAFYKSRNAYEISGEPRTKFKLINGYLSVTVGYQYDLGSQDSPICYYDVRTAVFDIYTGERRELSDLFFEGFDFVPLLNNYLAAQSNEPYSSFGTTHEMISDFAGLYEGDFCFTADSIIFKPGGCFADGVELSLGGLSEYMVTSIPRDMAGLVDELTPVYKIIKTGYGSVPKEAGEFTLWYLDKETALISDEVCDKINGYIDYIYDNYLTKEKLDAFVTSKGGNADDYFVGPYPDLSVSVVGERYIELFGANTVFTDGKEFDILDGHISDYYFEYYFNAETGEELRVGDLFTEGWEEKAEFYAANDNFNTRDKASNTAYTLPIDLDSCRVVDIENYISAPFNNGTLTDLEWDAVVYIACENGDQAAVCIPREFIK